MPMVDATPVTTHVHRAVLDFNLVPVLVIVPYQNTIVPVLVLLISI